MDTTTQDLELLFFDTFAQTDVHEGPQLGLVQFPNPIIIKEIRVIPLGSRVEADFAGGFRLGATNPSAFELEFFINDLTKRNACTFLDIGSLHYKQNVNIVFVPNEMIPTDGLILRGMYSTLTLAIFGCIADISRIIADDEIHSSNAVSSEQIIDKEMNFTEEAINDNKTDYSIINELNVCERMDEIKVSQILQTLSENSPKSPKMKLSPQNETLLTVMKTENRETIVSLQCNDNNDRKKKEMSSHRSHQRSRDMERTHSRRSPLLVKQRKSKSRSRSKSKSRSTTPTSLKRHRNSHRSSPYYRSDRSPKRHRSSPRKDISRSASPHSPLHSYSVNLTSPPSRPYSRSRNRSPMKSPLFLTYGLDEPKVTNEEICKSENKLKEETGNLDDSELFDPLSPDNSLSDIAEKISDDENLEQIISDDSKSDQSKDGLEVISSEEEYEDDCNIDNELLIDYTEYDINSYADFGTFNPFQCEFTSLQSLKDPSLTGYELSEIDDSFEWSNESRLCHLLNSFGEHRNDKWVEIVEQLSLDVNKCLIRDDSLIKTLINFIADGINFELAMKQTNTAYKVRHLKAGIKLLTSLSQTSEELIKRILDLNVIHSLLELYNKPYMTIPVRLLILRAIDVICDWPVGVQHVINNIYTTSDDKSQQSKQTCYQRLLELLLEKPSTRIVVSLTCLLRKIHLFEVLIFLSKSCYQSIRYDTTVNDDSLSMSLNEILLIYKNANSLLSQPFRSLPTTRQFELKSSSIDSYKSMYKYFKHNNFIDCLINILSEKTCNTDAFDCAIDLLNTISNMNHGLRFLLSYDMINSTNNLQKVVTQQCDEAETPLQTIGLKLIYRLQVLQLIDSIFSFHASHERSKTVTIKENFDDTELVTTLTSLYTMMFTGIGKDAIVHVMSSENNFDSILPFITLTGDQSKELLISKLVSCGCALDLCLVTLELIDTNLMSFLDTYGHNLLKVCENESIPKLKTISNWLSPIKNVSYNTYTENTFKSLMSVIKKSYETICESNDLTVFTISPELITSLKILHNLCSPSEQTLSETEVQLKHKYAVIQIFSMDGLSQILSLLNKLSEVYLKSSHQSFALIGHEGSLVVHFIKPAVLIIKAIVQYLVTSRGIEFRDITAVPILIRIYSVLALVPSSASIQFMISSTAQQIQYEISEILLIYTELYININESDEAITKSIWTKMVKYIIDYTLSSPLALTHGLTLLSDVLPQPLPLLVKQPMLNNEVNKTVNFRKLWSLHIHVLNESIEQLISAYLSSNLQSIQMLLKRVCTQLCDLSVPTATIVTKAVYQSLVSSIETFNNITNESGNVTICPTVRILNIIYDLMAFIPFRLGLSCNLSNCIQKDDKNAFILTRLQSHLQKSSQISSNEFINLILQTPNESDPVISEILNSNITDINKSDGNITETSALNVESLSNYFANRRVFVLEGDPNLPEWLSIENEDSEQIDNSDAIKVDLIEMSAKYFGNEFDIRMSLEKLWSEPINDTQSKENETIEKTTQPLIRHKEMIVINKRIQAPRGRGRSFTRLNDPFRSRPPNTSRPPSMHVDDFVALERYDPNTKRKDMVRPNRGGMGTSVRNFSTNQRSTNANNYRNSPISARNLTDRYSGSRDVYPLSSNRNKPESNNSNNSGMRWTRISGNRHDIRYQQNSRSFTRSNN
ncbi:protein virilizer homolog [Oppia nitens]|uniref:protein virilizer homolog n=1 Tax=Oppia nitens TaxID=1686743 RepID=UPI0023DBCC07|nr:protein virilizer homolog [Oppia nitens]